MTRAGIPRWVLALLAGMLLLPGGCGVAPTAGIGVAGPGWEAAEVQGETNASLTPTPQPTTAISSTETPTIRLRTYPHFWYPRPPTLEEAVAQSDVILVGQVTGPGPLDGLCEPDSQVDCSLLTAYEVAVERYIKGAGSDVVWVRRGKRALPPLITGERYLLLARAGYGKEGQYLGPTDAPPSEFWLDDEASRPYGPPDAEVVVVEPHFPPQPERVLLRRVEALVWGETPAGFNVDARLSVRPETVQVAVGETFTVAVELDSKVATRSVQFVLRYDERVLRREAVTPGDYYRQWAAENGAQMVKVVAMSGNAEGTRTDVAMAILGGPPSSGPYGAGVVAEYRFTAIAEGVTALALENVEVGDATLKGLAGQYGGLAMQAGRVEVAAGPEGEAEGAVGAPPTPRPTAVAAAPTETPPGFEAEARVRVEPETVRVQVGETFTVAVVLESNVATRGVQVALRHDGTVLRREGVTAGDYYRRWVAEHGGQVLELPAMGGTAERPATDVAMAIMGGPPSGPVGAGVVAEYRYTALAAGETALALENAVVAGVEGTPWTSLPQYRKPGFSLWAGQDWLPVASGRVEVAAP